MKKFIAALALSSAAIATPVPAQATVNDITITATATYKIDGGYQVIFHFVNNGPEITLLPDSCVVGTDRYGCTVVDFYEPYVAPANYTGDFAENIVSRDSATKGGTFTFEIEGTDVVVPFSKVTTH